MTSDPNKPNEADYYWLNLWPVQITSAKVLHALADTGMTFFLGSLSNMAG